MTALMFVTWNEIAFLEDNVEHIKTKHAHKRKQQQMKGTNTMRRVNFSRILIEGTATANCSDHDILLLLPLFAIAEISEQFENIT